MEQIVREIIGRQRRRRPPPRIPNGVDLDDLRADASSSRFATTRADRQAPFVLGLWPCHPPKGLSPADRRLRRSSPSDWRLVIAGEGRELDALKAQAQPLADRVVFTGLVEGTDKRWLLQNCRFMAAPSLEESLWQRRP